MFENKLITLLRTLKTKEISRFSEFVHSPYFNKHEQVSALSDYLLKLAPDFSDSQKLQKEKVYARLFGSKTYDDNFFASIISKLLKLLEDFLAQELFDSKFCKKELLVLEAMRLRKLDKHFKTAERSCTKALNGVIEGQIEQTYQKMQLAKEQDQWFVEQGGRVYNESLQKQSDLLDAYFIIEKLKLACDMENRNRVSRSDYQAKLLAEIELFIAQQPDFALSYPIITMYLLVLDLLRNSNSEQYEQLKIEIGNQQDKLGAAERKEFYGYALNFCIQQVNRGEDRYFKEILSIYKSLLYNGLLFSEGQLPAWEYKNIVTAALRCREFDWTETFLKDYKKYLSADVMENSYRYNSASFYYGAGRYKEALQLLHNVSFTDITYHLGAKTIQLKIYFELKEWDALLASLDAFTAYLRRNKELAEYQKIANMNLVTVCRNMAKLIQMSDWKKEASLANKKNNIRIQLESLKPLPSKEWLEEQWREFFT